MDDSLVMGRGHGLAGAAEDADKLGPIAAIQKIVGDAFGHQGAESFPAHLLHGVKAIAVRQEPGFEDRDCSGMVEVGEDLGLGKETLTDITLGGVLRPQPFDGDGTLQLDVGRFLDDRHSTLAKGFANQIAISGAGIGPFVGLDVVTRSPVTGRIPVEKPRFPGCFALGLRALFVLVVTCHQRSPTPPPRLCMVSVERL